MIQGLGDQAHTPPVHLLYGCKAAHDMPFIEEFEELTAQNPSFQAWFCAESGARQNVRNGRIDACLEDAHLGDADYFLCGPPKMLETMKTSLAGLGVSDARIFTEGY